MWHHDHDEDEEIELMRQEVGLLQQILAKLTPAAPRLTGIKIQFGGIMPIGPVSLNVGQNVTASVVGFDQNGAPYTGPMPAATFSIDNSAVATIDPASGLTTGVSAGVANATASLTTAEGLALSDTETVTVLAVVPKLSSIKISFQ